MPAQPVNPHQAFARLAHRTGLLGETFHRKRSLAPLVSALGGIRGDRLDQAHMSLAARLPDYKPALLLREIQEKHALVRTWGLRGQLQIVATPELSEFLAAAAAAPRWRRFLEGKTKLSPQARLRLLKRLCPRVISRDALKDAFPDTSMRLFILREAAQAGHILWKDGEGSAASFVWTKDVLGRSVEPERDFRPLIRRYLGSYAPLTANDLGSWLGVTVAAARLLMAKHRVVEVVEEGEVASQFIRPDDLKELLSMRKSAARGLVVVPPGDPFMLAYKTRYRVAGGDDNPGLVFLDARVVARWSLSRAGAAMTVLDRDVGKRAEKAVRSLLERSGVEASLTAAAP